MVIILYICLCICVVRTDNTLIKLKFGKHVNSKIKILNISIAQVGIDPTTVAFLVAQFCPHAMPRSKCQFDIINIILHSSKSYITM